MSPLWAATAVLPVLMATVLVAYALTRARSAPTSSPDRRPHAFVWAERRGVALTERSVPYVDTYLRNARALRFVCGAGGLVLAFLVRYGTGIETAGVGVAPGLGGYLVGSMWAELSLARVPASTTREASLVVRDPSAYRRRWLTAGQLVMPAVVVPVAAVVGVNAGPGTNTRTQAALTIGLVLTSLAFTLLGQRHIVRRPQPRSEPDLVAADEAMRTSAVHVLGVTHLVLCLLLLSVLIPATDGGASGLAAPVLALAAFFAWSFRMQWPGTPGGPVAPPSFTRGDADAVDLTTSTGLAWTAPRRPDAVAFTIIAVLATALWGLHWWGPLNPEVVASFAGSTGIEGPNGVVETAMNVVVRIENHSRSPIELTALHIHDGGPERLDAQGRPAGTASVHQVLGPGEIAHVSVEVPVPLCAGDAFPGSFYASHAEVRSAAGRDFTIGLADARLSSIGCTTDLPPPGIPPEDPGAARAAIAHAFDIAYSGEPPASKNGVIDGNEGLASATDQARNGAMREYVGTTRAVVTHVVFDRPDHAWVAYELRHGGSLLRVQRGEAVLVDGVWKVARSTVCRDLTLAGARCPEESR